MHGIPYKKIKKLLRQWRSNVAKRAYPNTKGYNLDFSFGRDFKQRHTIELWKGDELISWHVR